MSVYNPSVLAACRLVERYGEGQWAVISQQLNKAFGKTEDQGRIGKQCREVGLPVFPCDNMPASKPYHVSAAVSEPSKHSMLQDKQHAKAHTCDSTRQVCAVQVTPCLSFCPASHPFILLLLTMFCPGHTRPWCCSAGTITYTQTYARMHGQKQRNSSWLQRTGSWATNGQT